MRRAGLLRGRTGRVTGFGSPSVAQGPLWPHGTWQCQMNKERPRLLEGSAGGSERRAAIEDNALAPVDRNVGLVQTPISLGFDTANLTQRERFRVSTLNSRP